MQERRSSWLFVLEQYDSGVIEPDRTRKAGTVKHEQ